MRLNARAEARVSAEVAKAQYQLRRDVKDFLRRCESGEEIQRLKRLPDSRDLVPWFEKYVEAVFDIEIHEKLPTARISDSLGDFQLEMRVALERIIDETCPGLWISIVGRATKHFVPQATKYGTFGSVVLTNPAESALRRTLEDRSIYWTAKGWDAATSRNEVRTRKLLTRKPRKIGAGQEPAMMPEEAPTAATALLRDGAKGAGPRKMSRAVGNPDAAAKLKAYLERTQMKVWRFAERALLSKKTIYRFLRTGRADEGSVDQIAKVMDMTRDELLGSECPHGELTSVAGTLPGAATSLN